MRGNFFRENTRNFGGEQRTLEGDRAATLIIKRVFFQTQHMLVFVFGRAFFSLDFSSLV